ncbi:MAG TPA: glycosyltransferase family 2 protein [Bacteroidales bacterium]|nr:glycosyltransferase family 2 protein [Bacteroidales bacterium]
MSCRLAVVIPAYKEDFLWETLESVARQTCTDFRLYVGDDTGSGRLEQIVNSFNERIDIVYRKFDENIGLSDLAAQWERCIKLTTGEEYIWLFSDDDLMPDEGVALFYKKVDEEIKYDLYRFNIRQIDSKGIFISERTDHPEIESSENFIYRRLKGETLSAACEYIFSRKAFDKAGGFVNFPLAWYSDDASWYLFSHDSGIFTITGDPVLWRLSQTNISNPEWERRKKYKATLMFHSWLKGQNISQKINELIPFSIRRQTGILNISLSMFISNLHEICFLVSIREILRIWLLILKRSNQFS